MTEDRHLPSAPTLRLAEALPSPLAEDAPNPMPTATRAVPAQRGKRRDNPVRIIKVPPGLTCFRCDEPAEFRILVDGEPRASVCQHHKTNEYFRMRRALGFTVSKPGTRQRRPRLPLPTPGEVRSGWALSRSLRRP